MTKAEEFFNDLAAQVPDVKASKMFGAPCMKTPNGKSAAMYWKDNIVVKLAGNDYDEAMGLKGAKVFEPMAGRPMTGWVQLPFAHKDKWKHYAAISAADVKKLEKKPAKKKK